jgi:sialidase-1
MFNRRRFCQGAAATVFLTATGARHSVSFATKSLATSGTLQPVFETIICRWTPENPRHDHQLVFPLDDERVMLVWSEYYVDRPSLIGRQPTTTAGQAADEVPCRISARISIDRCRTWSDRFILQENVWKNNVKHPNLVRLPNGDVLFFFVGWDSTEQRNVFMKRSHDNCETWSEIVQVSQPGWFCNNHGRILQLKSGRIILPCHAPAKDGLVGVPYSNECHLHSLVFYSDDGFRTWKQSEDTMTAPGRGAHEPSVVELKDGRLLCLLRTTTGTLYRSYSNDEGVHWTKPEPTHFPAPDVEPLVTRIPTTGDLMVMWNNVESKSNWPRTPLSVAISKDEGQTWGHYHDIDARPNRDAAYPFVFFQQDEAVVSYYTRPTSWSRDAEVNQKIFRIEQFYD